MLPSDILRILVCPICKTELIYDREKNEFICPRCNTLYPVVEGIPDLRPEAAIKLSSNRSEEDSNN